ncbi:MAG TPA: amylo-alpha-1,6-glucosidase [Candidatus Acidoferrum sp.]|nr:amylo-alpha-1,6-glucosidase [Candidatus Acidoferrum sp.]
MSDIVRVEDEYYVRASSALADDRTRVLKYGDTFAVFNRYGDIEPLGTSRFGLFHAETRHLSRLTLRLNQKQPLLLSSTIREDNAFLSVDLTNVDTPLDGEAELARGTVHLFRLQFLRSATCYQYFRLLNYGLQPVKVCLLVQFEADFADIFEVRGTHRARKGQRLPALAEGNRVVLSYRGLDDVLRATCLEFAPSPAALSTSEAVFQVTLQPKEEQSVSCTIGCERNGQPLTVAPFSSAFRGLEQQFERPGIDECAITTPSETFNAWLTRSSADLRMLIEGNPEGPYPYAGVPWFNTVFGRDGIITALECLWMAPRIAEGVLKYLAETQATEEVPERDAEPGKILHEMRRGEMSVMNEVPFARYYGSVDSTPLFVMLAGAYFRRTANLAFLKEVWPNIKRAIQWIDTYGDRDQDGFVEYEQRSSKGLVQQGWKDSYDSIFHADGRMADAPIALCEVQGYVYAAKRSAAVIARAFQEIDLAERLEAQAQALREKFDQAFWCAELGMYALALDGKKKQCQVRSSNAGHALLCRIAKEERAKTLVTSLMSEETYSGWGIRTIGAAEARYNPMSYHNGSVWPHDNALIGLGFSLYGFHQQASEVLHGLFEVSRSVELQRLPELFCGFHKRPGANGPTLYPVACAPQAWSAGAVFMLLRACLGMTLRAPERQICFDHPVLPTGLDQVQIENLRLVDASVDVLVQRHDAGIAVEVLRRRGEVEIMKAL